MVSLTGIFPLRHLRDYRFSRRLVDSFGYENTHYRERLPAAVVTRSAGLPALVRPRPRASFPARGPAPRAAAPRRYATLFLRDLAGVAAIQAVPASAGRHGRDEGGPAGPPLQQKRRALDADQLAELLVDPIARAPGGRRRTAPGTGSSTPPGQPRAGRCGRLLPLLRAPAPVPSAARVRRGSRWQVLCSGRQSRRADTPPRVRVEKNPPGPPVPLSL